VLHRSFTVVREPQPRGEGGSPISRKKTGKGRGRRREDMKRSPKTTESGISFGLPTPAGGGDSTGVTTGVAEENAAFMGKAEAWKVRKRCGVKIFNS